MITRTNVRLGLTGAIFLMILGAFSGCADSPTGLAASEDEPVECVIINGIIMCTDR